MKTSQYILFSFIGFIVITVLVLFIDSIGKEDYYRLPHLNEKVKLGTTIPKKHLDNFSVIVAENKADIIIRNDTINNENSISAKLFETDSVYILPKHRIINDTLYISKSEYAAKTLITCNTIKTVIGRDGSSIHLGTYKADSLSIYLDKSKITGWLSNKVINYIAIEAYNKSDLSFSLSKTNINNSTLKVDNSQVSIAYNKKSKIQNLLAVLKNKSFISINKVEKLEIICDTLSSYRFY